MAVRKRGKGIRQHACLNAVRDVKLGADALLLLCRGCQVVHIAENAQLHVTDIQIQVENLVIAPRGNLDDLCHQVLFCFLPAKCTGLLCQVTDRIRHHPPDKDAAKEGSESKDGNAQGDHAQDEQVPCFHDLIHVLNGTDHGRTAFVRR